MGKIGGGLYRLREVNGHAGETVTSEMCYHVAYIAEFNYPITLATNFQDAGSLQYLCPAWWLLFPRTVGESGGQMLGDLKFAGAVPAANGMIIFAPKVANRVGVFDPGDESLQLIDISAQLSSDLKFAGAAPAAVGMIIFRPDAAEDQRQVDRRGDRLQLRAGLDPDQEDRIDPAGLGGAGAGAGGGSDDPAAPALSRAWMHRTPFWARAAGAPARTCA